MYSNDATRTANPQEYFYKQWERIPDGLYLVTRIFKPNKYPQATICTTSFRVSVPEDEWITLRKEIFQKIQSGKRIAIRTIHGTWTIDETEEFDFADKLTDEYGMKWTYPSPRDCFIPSPKSVNSINPNNEDEIPF